MLVTVIACARCTQGNHPSSRFCDRCGLPLGAVQADVDAGMDALGPYEPPDPHDFDAAGPIRDLVACSGFGAVPFGHGFRLIVPLNLDRHQAVYIGRSGLDPVAGPLITLVSVCGPANTRDARILLKLNAVALEGYFAIKVLRGEEYFVVTRNLPVSAVPQTDAAMLVRRIAETADGLEDRLSRGRDLY